MTNKELIQALRLCSCETSTRNCPTCPLSGNDDCVTDALREAADIIERLTAENAKAEAERDAAIADLKISSGCASCKYHCSDTTFCCDCTKKQNCKCMSCSLGLTNWEWRGLPEAPEEGEKGNA